MHIVFLILLIIWLAANSIISARETRRLKDEVIVERERIRLYKETILWSWVTVFVVLSICLFSGISFGDIGLCAIDFGYGLYFTALTFVLCAALFAVLLYQIISYNISAKHREKVKTRLAKAASKNHHTAVLYNLIIPRSKREKQVFCAVSVTAGISEEIVWRGFLLYLLFTIFPETQAIALVLSASAVFGAGHIYQGLNGALKTALAGALFGCLYLVSGSLLPAILLHIYVDFSNIFVLSDDSV